MNINTAYAIVNTQDRNLRRVDGIRFTDNGYEYRLTYRGGFANYVAIDRREIGKRNFKYFGGVGAYHCWNVKQVLELVRDEIRKVTKNG